MSGNDGALWTFFITGALSVAVVLGAMAAFLVLSQRRTIALHRKYAIDAVPLVVVADARGVVGASFIGPASATDLWAAVAEVRQPGSSPEPDLGR